MPKRLERQAVTGLFAKSTAKPEVGFLIPNRKKEDFTAENAELKGEKGEEKKVHFSILPLSAAISATSSSPSSSSSSAPEVGSTSPCSPDAAFSAHSAVRSSSSPWSPGAPPIAMGLRWRLSRAWDRLLMGLLHGTLGMGG